MPKTTNNKASVDPKKTETAAKPKEAKMANTISVNLPCVVTEWTDEYLNSRLHCFLHVLSGTNKNDILGNPTIQDSNLLIEIKVNELMLNPERLMGHPSYKNDYYAPIHPKVVALKTTVNNLVGGNDHIKAVVKIKLPGSGYFFTPQAISGHHPILPIETVEASQANENVSILMFDLMKRAEGPSYTTAKKKKSKSKSPNSRKNKYVLG